ncbi:MAG TPA: molybdopterin molybdenumtransferase MoeA [Porticoccus sp.]|nr:molybdopterin molybdenumtransferase MoeA [Porticoccus sp.]
MSCCDQSGLQPVEQALETLLSSAQPMTETERVPVEQALGRVLAEDQQSTVDVPPADNSAMDGFAYNSADTQGPSFQKRESVTLPISQRIPAGLAPQPLQPGTAARIFTGAEVPAGADIVVMQENCQWNDAPDDKNQVTLPAEPKAGDNIRPQGQDIKSGSVIMSRGHRIKPQDMGLLASVGIAEVPVFRKLKVAVLSTGDELVEPGTELPPGHIYNSNRYTLAGQMKALGFDYIDLGIVPDNFEATEQALRKAAAEADCIVTSGGVSVGEEDHVKACVEKLGSLDLWRLAIKPGKPLAFGNVLGTPILGLPGNPAAVFVTCAIIARPFLLKCQGASELLPTPIQVVANFDRPKPAKRQEYLRAKLVLNEQGMACAELAGNQSSGVLSTASVGNGFAVHPLGGTITSGEPVQFLLFSDLLF